LRIVVALATFDGDRYLAAQLESLRVQERAPDLLLVRDDGSSDSTIEILERFVELAPFPVAVMDRSDHLGTVGCFERVLAAVQGDVFVLCDQDDTWRSDKLAEIERAFTVDEPPCLVFSDGRLIDHVGAPLRGTLWSRFGTVLPRGPADLNLLVRALHAPSVPGCTMAFDDGLRTMALPFPDALRRGEVDMKHDGWMLALASARPGGVQAVAAALIAYRVHPSQQIGLRDRGARRSVRHMRRVATSTIQLGAELDRRRLAAQLVAERLADSGDGSAARFQRELGRLMTHLDRRSTLPSELAARIRVLRREFKDGGYSRYSSGLTSLLRDAARPVRPRRGA
jgi:hypothetical protein